MNEKKNTETKIKNKIPKSTMFVTALRKHINIFVLWIGNNKIKNETHNK